MKSFSIKDLFENKQYDEIITLCDKFLDNNPSDANALYNRARCNHMLGHFPQAIKDYRASIAAGHANPEKVQEKLRACKFASGFGEAIATPMRPQPRAESWCQFFTRQAIIAAEAALLTGVVYYTMGDKLGMK